jgi:FMN phosphatase YigB (HAD superfamily)
VIGLRCIALDVGGVIYYDAPFELAWIHEVLDRATAVNPGFTVPDLMRDMATFYDARRPHEHTGTVFFQPLARESWLSVRRRWNELVQAIPGAVDAVRQLASRYEVCVVANQPPECSDALDALDLADSLQLIALDSVVGYAKPDPLLLRWALSSLETPADRTLAVGNRWDHDIAPARTLGCPAALVRSDDRWHPLAGFHPQIVAAYRRLKRRYGYPSGIDDGVAVVGDLAELARLLVPGSAGALARARPA